MKASAPHYISPWEEGSLRLRNLAEEGGRLIAGGDSVKFSLPLDLKDKLAQFLGMKISILRTDIDDYRIRILDD
jgi:hypothetical protein